MSYKTPNITFVDVDTASLVEEMEADFTSYTGRKLAKADPMRLILLWFADILARQRAVIDAAAKMNSPRFAEGEYLDLLCELFDRAGRRQASPARTTIRFYLSEKRPSTVAVAAGTRVRGDWEGVSAVFETEEELLIPPGKEYGDVSAVSVENGTAANGFPAGTVTECVDVFNYYRASENLTVSEGGADTETDAEFYEQMRKSMEGYSTAGPEGAYEYWAKAANPGIADVKATSEVEYGTALLPVYERGGEKFAFFASEQLLTVTGCRTVGEEPVAGVSGVDFRVDYDGSLARIALLPTGLFADADEMEISYTRERAGHVRVSVLMEGGGIPGREILSEVRDALNDQRIRPLTDVVTVTAPDVVSYRIDLSYFIPYGGVSAKEAEAAVTKAVEDYAAWQCEAMGRDVNPSKLVEFVMKTGVVKRVEVREPVYTVTDHCAVASLLSKTVVSGGREYE